MRKFLKKILGQKGISILKALFWKKIFSEADIILAYFKKRKEIGTMFDVGVHFGESFISYAKMNWQIVGFEPNPECRQALPAFSNFKLYANAVSNVDDLDVLLYTNKESTGITSLIPFHKDHVATNTVKTITLRTVVNELDIKRLDFLKIDIEGYDFFALKGFPFEKIKPRIILCEFEDFKTMKLGYTFKDLGDFLIANGYKVWISEWYPIVKYGVQHKWREIRSYDGVLKDPKGWGNFIAVGDEDSMEFDFFLKSFLKK